MNSFLSLTKAFKKNLSMSKSTGKKKIIFNILLLLVVLFIFIPFIVCISILVYDMTLNLKNINYESIGLDLLCILLCLFVFIFSFNVILNELYFNDNIKDLLPLPIKPWKLVLSKFTTCYIAENIMSFFIILFGVLGYYFALKLNLGNFLLSLLGIITLPIIPMIYMGIICMIIMYFTKFIKNKQTIRDMGMILVFIVLFIFIFSINSLQQLDFDEYIEGFALGNHTFLNVMNGVFPHIGLFIDTLNNGSIISLLLYILVNIIYIGVFLVLSNYLYLGGVLDLSSKNTSSNKRINLDKIKRRSPFRSLFNKEIKLIFRSPNYFINCIIINIIWPVFIYLILEILNVFDLNRLKEIFSSIGNDNMIYYLLFIIGISVLVTSIGCIASSSFSREGKHFDFNKYIPVNYNVIWKYKLLVSFIINYLSIFIYMTIFFIICKVSFGLIIYSYVLMALLVLLISLIGILIDSLQPKLVWDDELNALRENYNTFIVMGISLIITGFLFIISFIFIRNGYSYISLYRLVIMLIIVFVFITYLLLKKFIVKNLVTQEEV